MLPYLAFVLAFALANVLHGLGGSEVTHSTIWLPSGVAIAGVWLLGPRSVGVVLGCALAQRLATGNAWLASCFGALGAAGEALLGRFVLDRCRTQRDFARVRDVLALFAAAAIAPVASVACSALARTVVGYGPQVSGYDGWWRMNALGVLVVVPLATTWSTARSLPSLRSAAEAAAIAVAVVAVLWAVMVRMEPSLSSVTLLYALLPLALYAALRVGQRGATATASCTAMAVYLLSSHGHGPFGLTAVPDRYIPIQLFELTLLVVPLLFGSLAAERHYSAQQWSRSEDLRTALLSVLPDVLYRIRRDGTVVDAIAPMGVALPTPREALLGQRLDALMAPDLAARMHAAIRHTLQHGRAEAIEYQSQAPTPSLVREARFTRLADDEVLVVVRDITDRARAEAALALQARVLERIATGRPLPEVFAKIVRGLEASIPRSQCSILMLRGRHLRLGHGASLPEVYNRAIDGFEIGPRRGTCGTAAHENRTVVTADIASDPAWESARSLALANGLRACWSVPIRAADGTVLGTFAMYHDAPRQPTALEIGLVERAAVLAGIAIEREQHEQLLTSIQRHVAEGLFRCVPGHGIAYCNAAFATMFGYESPEHLLAAVRADADLPPAHRADLLSLGEPAGAGQPQEIVLHRRDGTGFWALVSRTLVRDLDDGAGAFVGAIADVTGRRALEEQLRQAQKMEAIGQLAGGIAHDFNNLLTAISGYASSLGESLAADDPRRNDVRGVLDAAARAAGLTGQLLAFSRQQVLTPRVLDLTEVVDDLAGLLGRLIGAQITLQREHASRPVPVRVDRTQMEQVLLNLALNARDAMPDGGTLCIGTSVGAVDAGPDAARGTTGSHALLWVRDTGVGMDAERRAQAFLPFFTTKAPGKGTGLGLATVHGIVRQSGGDAWIDSAPGAGTTVWIRLPLANEAALPTPAAEPPTATGTATILLVEDEPLVRELVHRSLARAGHHVLVADDGEAALQLVRQHQGRIDLLITDVVMPGLGGRDLAARLGAERPGLPVLFVSGFTGDETDLELGGSSQLLPKPFSVPQLMAAVHDLLHATAR
ncbi:MAG: response regulator [Planctomycetes bacterium]|nr:response regulator [Planctomycetota bacterium]